MVRPFNDDAYERTMRAGMAGGAKQDANPHYTPLGRLGELYEALHRLVNAADDLEAQTAPYRTTVPPIASNEKQRANPAMSEMAERIDTAANNINAVADRLQAMADGFK